MSDTYKTNVSAGLIVLFLIGFISCSEKYDTADYKFDDFEKTWSTVESIYPYLEYKRINWDSIYAVYKPLIDDSEGDDYIELIYQMLCELKDAHVGIKFKNGDYWGYSTPRQIKDQNAFDLSITESYLDDNLAWLSENIISHATISDTIEYLYIQSFQGWNSSLVAALTDTLGIYKDFSDHLIIDIRHNGGGNSLYGDKIISHLISDSLKAPDRYYKNEFYEGPYIFSEPPQFSKEVVLLINGKCLSATEHFALRFQQIENSTIIGDTTAGGSGNAKYYLLPSGNKIRVSTTNYLRYDGTPIEWNGIVPDILVPQSEEDLKSNIDKQLEYALSFLIDQ